MRRHYQDLRSNYPNCDIQDTKFDVMLRLRRHSASAMASRFEQLRPSQNCRIHPNNLQLVTT